jgi:hypothetical protein
MSVHFHHDNARVLTSSFVERVEGFTNGACGMGRAVACYLPDVRSVPFGPPHSGPVLLSAPLTTLRSSSTVCSDASRLLEFKPRVICVVYAGSGVSILESAPGTKTPRILLARMSTTAPSAHFTQPAQFHAPRDSPCNDQTIHVQRCHVVSARAFDEGRLRPSVRHVPAFVHP